MHGEIAGGAVGAEEAEKAEETDESNTSSRVQRGIYSATLRESRGRSLTAFGMRDRFDQPTYRRTASAYQPLAEPHQLLSLGRGQHCRCVLLNLLDFRIDPIE